MKGQSRRALICGVSGQDGAYLARLLLNEGYEVYGASRDEQMCPFTNLHRLGIRDKVKTVSMTLVDFRSVLQVLTRYGPSEIYNLAGQSSVGLSFEQPVETLESITIGTLNLLEAIRFHDPGIRLYNACSGECFGDTGGVPANEETPFRPRSPYAVAKSAAYWEVANYREAYGIHACSGILFNHESPLRPTRFVTQKVVTTACRIASGSSEVLRLGDLSIRRDWGWAPEYVEAMWHMLRKDRPDDYVIATGQTNSLEDFVDQSFKHVGLEWKDHVVFDPNLVRVTDIHASEADVRKASRELGWSATYAMKDVVGLMIDEHKSNIGSGESAHKKSMTSSSGR